MLNTLNYNKLTDLKPTVYDTLINQRGQSIELVEHPTRGDEYPIIAIYHKEKIAVTTDFYDTEDFYEGSEYNPVYQHGAMHNAYELGY